MCEIEPDIVREVIKENEELRAEVEELKTLLTAALRTIPCNNPSQENLIASIYKALKN